MPAFHTAWEHLLGSVAWSEKLSRLRDLRGKRMPRVGFHARAQERARRHLRRIMLVAAFAGVIVLIIYVVLAGRTESWSEVPCRIIASRVVRADVQTPAYRSVTILYRGQFQLRYVVSDRVYAIWVDTSWVDDDPAFIERKLAAHPENQCEYRVRYNPRNPSEAVASLR